MPETPAHSMPYADTVGLLLAGGGGSRLGNVRKPDLRVGGRLLCDRALENLARQCGRVVIAAGIDPRRSNPRHSFVADPGQGPGAAMLCSVSTLASLTPLPEYLLLAPCDAPFMPTDFASRARAHFSGEVNAIIGNYEGQDYPTHALWRLSVLVELQTIFKDKDNPSLFGLLDRVGFNTVSFSRRDGGNPFLNINSPSELLNANRLIAKQ